VVFQDAWLDLWGGEAVGGGVHLFAVVCHESDGMAAYECERRVEATIKLNRRHEDE
jgi:hypothetical protein